MPSARSAPWLATSPSPSSTLPLHTSPLHQEVTRKADRTDYDLGPGLEIVEPGSKLAVPLPKEGSVYDYMLDKGKCQWLKWMDTVQVGGVKGKGVDGGGFGAWRLRCL